MGCIESSEKGEGGQEGEEERRAHAKISSQLRRDHLEARSVRKLLLLGTGESGKSTVVKQLRIVYGQGFSDSERREFVLSIHSNVVAALRFLVSLARANFGNGMSGDTERAVCLLLDLPPDSRLPPSISPTLRALWESNEIRITCQHPDSLSVGNAIQHYMGDIERVVDPDFLPTDQDIVFNRVKTTGIAEFEFAIDHNTFKLFDVGGQRNERRKWIHCFDNCDAVLFVTSLSEYNQTLEEDSSKNRMVESLNVFAEVCNSRFLKDISVILFLNKFDLFKEKFPRVPFAEFQPRFEGDSLEEAVQFLRTEFELNNRSPSRALYTHVTCATDTNNIRVVFNAVQDTVLTRHVRATGFV